MKHLVLMLIAAAGLMAADASGTWTGTLTPGDSTEGRPAYLVLRQDGAKLSGTAGPNADQQHTIENGKIEGDTLTFEVSGESGAMKFNLKLAGDEINGTLTRDHDGEKQSATLAVKRQK